MKPWKTVPFGESKIDIYGNHHTIPILYGYELRDNERAEFDYYEDMEELLFATFFRYRGETYDLNEFTSLHSSVWGIPPRWMTDLGMDGYLTEDSFFSGILIKYIQEDYEEVALRAYTFIC